MNAFRPRLTSFRVTEFSSQYEDVVAITQLEIDLHQEIMFALSSPEFEVPLHAAVTIKFHTEVRATEGATPPRFAGTYFATFEFPSGTTSDEATAWLDDEEHQYGIVSQAFPLAMMHLKREMLATGFDARTLPVGI